MANRLLVLQGSEARLQDPGTVQQGNIPGSLVPSATSDQTTQHSELYYRKAPGQNQRIDNAAEDLSRKAGDIALYGRFFSIKLYNAC